MPRDLLYGVAGAAGGAIVINMIRNFVSGLLPENLQAAAIAVDGLVAGGAVYAQQKGVAREYRAVLTGVSIVAGLSLVDGILNMFGMDVI